MNPDSLPPKTLSKEAIDDLDKIVKSELGDSLGEVELQQMGIRLLGLFRTVLTDPEKDEIDRTHHY